MTPQDKNKVQSVQAIRTTIPKKISLLVAAIILLITGIVYFANENENEVKTMRPQAIRIVCPAYPLQRVGVETPDGNRWSAIVPIPRECDFKISGDASAVVVQTLPDERQYGPGQYPPHLKDPEALRFRTRNKDTVTITFYPYGTLKRELGK